MNAMQTLGFALGTSFASGLNVYATVAALGLLHRFGVVRLPASLEVISHPAVLGVACGLYVLEFVADKIPYFDTLWDAVHTFIRPPAAAVLAYAAFGSVPESWRLAAGLLAGGVALTAHGTKASARMAANTSPEPFSNSILSLSEDGIAVFLAWMAAEHPIVTGASVIVLVAICGYLLYRLFGFMRQVLARIFPSLRTTGSAS